MTRASEYLEHDWFPTPLPSNVTIGERCWLYSSFAFRHFKSAHLRAVIIGNDTGLYNGTFFDLGRDGSVSIGNYCSLVGAIICANSSIVIEDYVFIAHEVVLADNAFAVPDQGDRQRPCPFGSDETSIRIRANAWIGARAVLLRGADIGVNSIVGAAAVVDFEVPDNSLVAGNPARIVGQVRPDS